jgi:hypothetical protein
MCEVGDGRKSRLRKALVLAWSEWSRGLGPDSCPVGESRKRFIELSSRLEWRKLSELSPHIRWKSVSFANVIRSSKPRLPLMASSQPAIGNLAGGSSCTPFAYTNSTASGEYYNSLISRCRLQRVDIEGLKHEHSHGSEQNHPSAASQNGAWSRQRIQGLLNLQARYPSLWCPMVTDRWSRRKYCRILLRLSPACKSSFQAEAQANPLFTNFQSVLESSWTADNAVTGMSDRKGISGQPACVHRSIEKRQLCGDIFPGLRKCLQGDS